MSHNDYLNRDHGNILQILRSQHLLILDGPTYGRKFNKEGLGKLVSITKDIVIHGMLSDITVSISLANKF
jgi:hypothetical protein